MISQAITPVTLRKYIYFAFSITAFTVPFFFSHNQVLTGTFVNFLLFASEILFPEKKNLAAIFFPSMAVLSRGLIFGPLTIFLIYLIPFIWFGNWLLVFSFENLSQKNFLKRVLISSCAKSIFLFISANLFFTLHLIPKIFLQSMGIIQFATACLGGIISYGFIVGAHHGVPKGSPWRAPTN